MSTPASRASASASASGGHSLMDRAKSSHSFFGGEGDIFRLDRFAARPTHLMLIREHAQVLPSQLHQLSEGGAVVLEPVEASEDFQADVFDRQLGLFFDGCGDFPDTGGDQGVSKELLDFLF